MKVFVFIAMALCLLFLCTFQLSAQPEKKINHQTQSWFSLNNTIRLKNKFGLLADFHVRRNDFAAEPSFYLVRGGFNYWLKNNITFSLGYAHMWVSPGKPGYKTYADENRIYEQAQITSNIGKMIFLQRLRNEQRWQEILVNDLRTHQNKFSNRVRYLVSSTIPVVKNKNVPSLALSNEFCIQFGKAIVYNTFDQDRLFIGIKQKITRNLSFDIGYMLVFQQKASGYVYDENDTFRWFFYYTPDWRRKQL
jgi:hypothetical protein